MVISLFFRFQYNHPSLPLLSPILFSVKDTSTLNQFLLILALNEEENFLCYKQSSLARTVIVFLVFKKLFWIFQFSPPFKYFSTTQSLLCTTCNCRVNTFKEISGKNRKMLIFTLIWECLNYLWVEIFLVPQKISLCMQIFINFHICYFRQKYVLLS